MTETSKHDNDNQTTTTPESADDTGQRKLPTTFFQRHGLSVLGLVMAFLFIVVMVAQARR